jgi:hypothetical protein
MDTLKVREGNIASISVSPLLAVSGPAGSILPLVSLYPHFMTIQAESRPTIFILNIPVIRG